MKKIFAILLTLVMVISMFAGCGGNPEHDHDPTTEPTEVITDPTGETAVEDTIPDETEAPVEITVPETEAPTEVPTEAPTEAPTEPEATECKHDYKKTVVAPTQSAQGYTLYECKKCSYEYKSDYTAKLPADDNTKPVHQHDYKSKVTNPTCTSKGYTTYTCSCGDSYKSDEKPALGHNWGNWVVTKEPTTSSEGQETRTCSNCGNAETRKVDKLPANDGGNSDGGYYWFGNMKIEWNCASQGHHVTNKDRDGKRIQRVSCIHDEIWEYTCDVVGCGATWTENKGGAGGVSHIMSAADQAKVTKGVTIYHFGCACNGGFDAYTREAALALINDHIAQNLYNGLCEITNESEGHDHNFPDSTFNCAVCNKEIPFHVSYVVCTCD